ncbi:hypothetical protein LIER_06160 [Lithospermum erythrorhizon]|uniref:Uncharacterized protein n=1 Tax=Lithospermum erythrorhizon TaxID=34254 RepID=A0AAV3P3T3_LITER
MEAATIGATFFNKSAIFKASKPSEICYPNKRLDFYTNFKHPNFPFLPQRLIVNKCFIMQSSISLLHPIEAEKCRESEKNDENGIKNGFLLRFFSAILDFYTYLKHPNYPFSPQRLIVNNCSIGQSSISLLHPKEAEKCRESEKTGENGIKIGFLLKILASIVCGVVVLWCRRVMAYEVVGGVEVVDRGMVVLRNSWPKVLQVFRVFKEHGLVLAALLGLSAFFSMAETSITTLWPWKVRELAEKEPDNGVFTMLHRDVTRFLTTILIGTTVVNIGATALVTEAATAVFGEAGVSAATGVMTVLILLLTEITPKSVAVHNATEVARIVVRPVAWLSLILYPVGRVVTYLSMGMLKLLGLKGSSEPFVTEDELKLMLRGAELSGAIEEEEQDMIENVLEIKDTHVREVMTPLVDVMAIDATATLIDFHHLWVTHQYSRIPVFEQRIDNIVGIAYAMDLLDYVQKGDLLESSIVGDMAHKPAYFVPDSMSVWNLLREFRIRKVHMAVVLNEYGGTIGVVTLEDVVEEIVGEIFDENDSKERGNSEENWVYCNAGRGNI